MEGGCIEMKSLMIGMLAETAIHPGSGRSSGFVDLPVARESITQYPVIVGSSLKGALKDRAREIWPDIITEIGSKKEHTLKPEVARLFGHQEGAGDLVVSDAKLLLLPVRSLTGIYKWATCPYLLERIKRDAQRTRYEKTIEGLNISGRPNKGTVWSNKDDNLFLEEREFQVSGKIEDSLIEVIKKLIFHNETAERLSEQLIILNDDDFQWFASYGLQICARNVLDVETKESKNLWYEETLPTDSLFYTLLFLRKDEALKDVDLLLKSLKYLQVGGNETVGQGWFAMKLLAHTETSEG
jgi:CRISPR-associated protein Cmr4